MLLGARQFFETRAPALPYDAEVAYLEGTGTQCINTGIFARDGLLARIRAMVTVNPTSQKYWFRGPGSGSRAAFGACDDYENRLLRVAMNTPSFVTTDFMISNNTWYVVDVCTTAGAKYASVDGVRVYESATSRPDIATSPVYLFASANGLTPHDGLRVAAFSARDTATGDMLIDLIPVRKDGVGYMFDRVSGNLLGNSGTGEFVIGPDKNYDYEVEYVERDYGVPWLVDGASVAGGFDLARYVSDDSPATIQKAIEMCWSFVPESAGTRLVFRMTNNALNGGAFHFCKKNDSTVYAATISTVQTSGIAGDIDVFHVQKNMSDGQGNVACYLDGVSFYNVTLTATTGFSFCSLLYGSYTSGSGFRARVKYLKIGDDVNLIPVVKGNAVGFYNLVDGELFVAEQACLSAGPRA